MESSRPNRRRALVALALAVPVVLGATACSGAGSSPSSAPASGHPALFSELPADIQKQGSLTVASDVEYPPFESFDTDNTTVVGIDRSLADEFEKQLGVKLKFTNVAFDSIIPGLAAGRYDMAMSAMSDTVVRQKQVDFVDYFHAGGAIMLPPGAGGSIKSLADLCGKNVAIVKGTTEVDAASAQSTKCVASGKAAITSTIYPGQSEAVLAVQNGRADAGMFDYTAASYVAQTSKTGMKVLPPYEKGAFGLVFPKGSKLSPVFQKALKAVAADGTYLAILKKFGQEGGALKEFPINGITS